MPYAISVWGISFGLAALMAVVSVKGMWVTPKGELRRCTLPLVFLSFLAVNGFSVNTNKRQKQKKPALLKALRASSYFA